MSGHLRVLAVAASLIAITLAGWLAVSTHPARTVVRHTVTQPSANYAITVSPTEITAGQVVQVTVTVSGPLYVEFGCVMPLDIYVTDVNGHRVWHLPYKDPCPNIGEAGPPTGVHRLRAGETQTFSDTWPSSPDLPTGTYTIHTAFQLAFGLQMLPAVPVQIVAPQGCPNCRASRT